MQFEHDVFISYPHLSNKEDLGGSNGWVAKFHADLNLRLSEMLGRKALVWRDNKMPFGAVVDDTIRSRLRKSRVLLCIVSPSYAKSKWCLDELQEFRAAAPQNGGLVVGEQSRVIPVVKTPTVPLPEGLDRWLTCEFYRTDDDRGGAPVEFSQTAGSHGYDEYRARVNEVAWAIKLVVERLGGDDPPSEIRRTVYLAETTRDRAEDRLMIKRELETRDLIVLPDASLPNATASEYAEAVRECLRLSFMSVHLMGGTYGLIPDEGEGKSVPHIQNELAAERSEGDSQFTRVIWISEELQKIETRQAEFLNELRESDAALAGAELIERSLQGMKTRLLQLLKKKDEEDEDPPPDDNLIRIYLMCDKADNDSVKPVGSFLFAKGFEVYLPPQSQKKKSAFRYHRDCLRGCDATLTIYGNAEYEWVLGRHDDLVKSGRESRVNCEAILPTDPETMYKSMLFLKYVKVLSPCYNGLSDEALKASLGEFIVALEQELRG